MLNVECKSKGQVLQTSNLELRTSNFEPSAPLTPLVENPACDEKEEIRPGYYAFPFQE